MDLDLLCNNSQVDLRQRAQGCHIIIRLLALYRRNRTFEVVPTRRALEERQKRAESSGRVGSASGGPKVGDGDSGGQCGEREKLEWPDPWLVRVMTVACF